MKIYLLENQIDVVLKSLENYTKIDPDNYKSKNYVYNDYNKIIYMLAKEGNHYIICIYYIAQNQSFI